jgi:hypothetical protein
MMTVWSDADLLDLWSRGRAESPQMRARALLSACEPSESAAAWRDISVGRRDARLIAFRRQLFGDPAEALADCSLCGATLEFGFKMSDFQAPDQGGNAGPVALRTDGWEVTFRLPGTGDLASLSRSSNLTDARAAILARCVLKATHDGHTMAANRLPDEVMERVAEGMAEADPLGAIDLNLTCPACSAQWDAPFDILSFLWTELDAFARGLMNDVHGLASAYGWTEGDILSMAGSRRQFYLEMIGA